MTANKIKKVLIALDYDPTAKKVAEVGFLLAKTMNAEVTLLHVMSDPVYYSLTEFSPVLGTTDPLKTSSLQLDTVDGIKKATQHFLEESKRFLGDETIQILLKEGDFADSILSTAKDLKSDVIVLGSHSRKWLEEILMGSVTEKVLNNTSIPLFIVPTKKQRGFKENQIR